MANVTGSFVADGVSTGYTGITGNIAVSVKVDAASTGSFFLEVSYDAETTWVPLEGGRLGNSSVDRVIVSAAPAVYYRIKALGITGSVPYFMGAE